MICGLQIRAARAILKWSAKEAGERSGISLPTIQRFEQLDGIPPSRSQTLMDLKRAFEEAGVEFIGSPDNGPGVRLKPKQ